MKRIAPKKKINVIIMAFISVIILNSGKDIQLELELEFILNQTSYGFFHRGDASQK